MADDPSLPAWLRAQLQADCQHVHDDIAWWWPNLDRIEIHALGLVAGGEQYIERLINPQWLLADLDARLRIVDLHTSGHECSGYDHHGEIDNCRYYHDFENCSTLRLLAAPYADRTGCKPEWLPE